MDLARYLRIFESSPTDDFVEKRQVAVNELAGLYQKKSNIVDILALANELAFSVTSKGQLSAILIPQAEAVIKKQSPSFVQDDHVLQIKVCALAAALKVLEDASPGGAVLLRSDFLAAGLWSALSFQKPLGQPKLEQLRQDILKRAAELTLATAESSRERLSVPDAVFGVTEAEAWAGLEKKWKAGPLKAIDALRFNAALDREEIDFLWWALSDWSDTFEKRLSALPVELRAVTAGVELSMLLKRLPAEAHKHLVLRTAGAGKAQNLKDLVKELGDKSSKFAEIYAENDALKRCPVVFPLLTMVVNGQEVGSGHKETRDISEWGARALLEAGILRVASLSNVIS